MEMGRPTSFDYIFGAWSYHCYLRNLAESERPYRECHEDSLEDFAEEHEA